MLFAIIGLIFFIESILLIVYAHKKKNGFLKYIGIVLSISIIVMIVTSLTHG
ncbi:hypothetical protein OIO07_17270 [Bacillus paralicheniformis]|jgi:branched-subunit amino acid transport protein AzlD|uniref:DUF3953 domain-containing protein n=2 Tax=Bacillus TaxID=1386 RepID=A0AAW6KJ12_9BACI|nr:MULTISPECIES: hypothetical protein [Bacillus]ETB72201.1 hypothetical protein A943_05300 [Bacillus sp. CPSM8]KUL07947.1 hypothetical protein LI7559_14690 [Bacillus licheniformis LMG 7559]KUL16263.1 hypothetical protein LI6934_16475 [Bacillus licheniformis LMG 6934]AGN35288.1 YflI [Bacillus paralicheniformis ATCC 9945a]AJO17034.1 hypothetical protein SC10_B2orf01269 [Bacillus paralicheniformis]